MKKLLILTVALASAFCANSQIVKSTTFTKQKSKTTWYVRAGLSMNNLTGGAVSDLKEDYGDPGEGESYGFGTRVGYDFDFGFMKNFGKSDLYWGMELGFGTRGGSYTEKEEDHGRDYVGQEWFDIYTFKFTPFQLGYMFNVTEDFKIDPHIGVFLSVDMGGTMKDQVKFNGEIDYKESYKYGRGDFDTAQRFDAGLQLGVGVWFKKFNLNFTWQRGFCTMIEYFPWSDYFDSTYQSSNAILSLGYAF